MHFDDCDTDDPVLRAERLVEQGEPERAVALLRALLTEGRGGLLTRIALGKAIAAAGDQNGALDLARETALLHPHAAVAALALGTVFADLEQLPLAIAELQRALRIDPDLTEARAALGRAWLAAGEPERALDVVASLDQSFEGADIAGRANAMRSQPRSDPGYVRHLFDQFAANYDVRMRQELSYAAPEILKQLTSLVIPDAHALSILDLGCGTGLAGAAFKPLARRLDGIDLSPKMISLARSRAIYDSLCVGDIEAPPADDLTYDLVLAADSFVYLGDLGKALHAAAHRLRPSGFLLFTVEKDEGTSFSLGAKRRWRHSEVYLRVESQRARLTVAGLLACVPRTEAGHAVDGLAVALEKQA